jgi:transcriptional regulator with XRE-family HTH domain
LTKTLGSLLLSLRKESGKSLAEVGRAIGISAPALHYLETDQKKPTFETITSLANYYEVSLEYLSWFLNSGDDEKSSLNDDSGEWFQLQKAMHLMFSRAKSGEISPESVSKLIEVLKSVK